MTVKLCKKRSGLAESCEALFTLGEVASAVKAQCRAEWSSIPVRRVITDSREACEGALFVALKGERFDGHDFVCDSFAGGAAAAIVSEMPLAAEAGWPLLVVDETLSALADLAAYYRSGLSIPVVGITGSCGKTTTKEFLGAALSPKYCVAKPKSSFNNIIGVSLTILGVRPRHEVLILELGTNAPGEIEALCRIGMPTMGIITNIGHAHIEKLGSVEGVKREKGALARYMGEGGILVTNVDCPECRELADEFGGQTVTVAIETTADHSVTPVVEDTGSLVFKYDGITATVPAPGMHNALNGGLAAAAAQALGVAPQEALGAMAGAKLPAMRMERELVGGVLFVNDAYNSNFESLKAAVDTLHKSSAPGRKILVCGDMFELGGVSESLHRAIGWHIGRTSIDILVTVGPGAWFIAEEAHKGGTGVIFHRKSVDEAGALLANMLKAGDVVLFKASRGVHLERAVARLRGVFGRAKAAVGS